VRELFERIDAEELIEWIAYERIEPFDGQRLEAYLAQVSMILANAHRGKNAPAVTFDKCLIKFGESPEQDNSIDAKKARFMAAIARTPAGGGKGGKDSNRKLAGSLNGGH